MKLLKILLSALLAVSPILILTFIALFPVLFLKIIVVLIALAFICGMIASGIEYYEEVFKDKW